MSNTVKDRLIQFIQYLSDASVAQGGKTVGQGKFEKHVGLTNATINNIGEGVSTVTLQKIKDKYPELNMHWVVTGEGLMIIDSAPENEVQQTLDALLAASTTIQRLNDRITELEKTVPQQGQTSEKGRRNAHLDPAAVRAHDSKSTDKDQDEGKV